MVARFLRPIAFGDIVAVISLFALLTLQLNIFADDPGVGWHLQGGKFIAESGHAPTVDHLLHSESPRVWISDQWFSDFLLYSLYKFGDWQLLYLVLILIYIGTYFGLLLKGTQRISTSYLASVIAVFLAFKIGLVHFILRPVVFTFPLFTLLILHLFVLYRAIKSGTLSALPKKSWMMPILFLAWANMHPSFLLGLVFMALLPVSLFLDGVFFKPEIFKARKLWTRILLLCALCFLITFVNPYGWKLHQTTTSLLSSDFFANLYQEWRSPNFKELPGSIVIFCLGVIALSALLTGNRGWGFFEVLSIIGVSALAAQASRNLPFFGIAISIPLAEALHKLAGVARLKTLPILRILCRPMAMVENRESRALPSVLFIAMLCALLAVYAKTGRVFLYNGSYGPSESYPREALNVIPKGSVVASTLSWGGFIVFHCDVKAIIDDRSTVLGEEYYREYFRRMNPSGDWKQYLKERGATHLLFPPDSPIALAASMEGYPLLHKDKLAALYLVP